MTELLRALAVVAALAAIDFVLEVVLDEIALTDLRRDLPHLEDAVASWAGDQ